MKPTTESIKAARGGAESIAHLSSSASTALYTALRLFEHDSPAASLRELKDARLALVSLRRTQTAALANIDDAILSAEVEP